MSRTVRRLITAAVLGALLMGCIPQGLAFKQDKRLAFSSPKNRATVTLPVRIDWDIRDFTIIAPGQGDPENQDEGYFAVFIDASPMPPGEPLRWLARKDRTCRASDGCPDAEYLNSRGVYLTTETELVIPQLPRGANEKRRDRHRATIVLLNSNSERMGESAFEIAFDVERKDL